MSSAQHDALPTRSRQVAACRAEAGVPGKVRELAKSTRTAAEAAARSAATPGRRAVGRPMSRRDAIGSCTAAFRRNRAQESGSGERG